MKYSKRYFFKISLDGLKMELKAVMNRLPISFLRLLTRKEKKKFKLDLIKQLYKEIK